MNYSKQHKYGIKTPQIVSTTLKYSDELMRIRQTCLGVRQSDPNPSQHKNRINT